MMVRLGFNTKFFKSFTIAVLGFVAISCNDKLVRKRIENNNILVQWYYYSYLTNISADFVEIYDKHSKTKSIVFEAVDLILDIELKKDSVIIFIDSPRMGIVYTDLHGLDSLVFNHVVKLDSTTLKGRIFDIPDGKKTLLWSENDSK